ncbi:hypothetical protein HUO09_17480 [Vibrio sp. Y2-5]|uniref:hypothetical protein n=1 Tax=Vibrio sp. Y2-5 TaxID=2743977 RepID=UPI0016617959|nr:hypothetical protein [Vibrio sp. Y2-5]MBD0788149.1 hypothetical protein [Vibrio sp. Y2-5]
MAFKYGIKQITTAAVLNKTIAGLSVMEVTRISNIITRNLNESTRTLLAVSADNIVAFQLDVGLNFKEFENEFAVAEVIFTVSTSKDDSFKPTFIKTTYNQAVKKANTLTMPITRNAVTSMIHYHKGKVPVNGSTISEWYKDFLKAGNHAMATYLNAAIINKVF